MQMSLNFLNTASFTKITLLEFYLLLLKQKLNASDTKSKRFNGKLVVIFPFRVLRHVIIIKTYSNLF